MFMGFSQAGQIAFFDVRVFNSNVRRYTKQELSKTYKHKLNKRDKKRLYNRPIMWIKHGIFTPLLMSSTGKIGRQSSKFYSQLLELISEKRKSSYSMVATWIR